LLYQDVKKVKAFGLCHMTKGLTRLVNYNIIKNEHE